MKKLVIFDMDGTIADTSPGIMASYRHVAIELGHQLPSNEDLSTVIGGSLPANLQRVYNLHNNEVKKAVEIYRDYYSREGYNKSSPYNGVKDAVIELKKYNCTLAVATMKAETFAVKLMNEWGLSNYFSYIYGVDTNDSISKPDMIFKCMSNSRISNHNTIMVGDSPQDLKAAEMCKTDFLAVTYGFQYTKKECLSNNIPFVTDAKSISKYIINLMENEGL